MTERLSEPGTAWQRDAEREREREREGGREKEESGEIKEGRGGWLVEGGSGEEVANRRGGVNRCRAAEGRTSRWRETQPV